MRRIPEPARQGANTAKSDHILQIVGGDAPSMLVVGGGLQTPHRLRMLNVRTEIFTLRRVELSICHDFEIAGEEVQWQSAHLHSGLTLQLRTQKSGAAENSSFEVRFLTNNQFSKVQIANCKLNTPRVGLRNVIYQFLEKYFSYSLYLKIEWILRVRVISIFLLAA